MRNTVSEAALNVQALTTILQANADANPDSCQTDEWKALLAAVSQLSVCTGMLAAACQTMTGVPMPIDDRLLDSGVLAPRYAVELQKAMEARP